MEPAAAARGGARRCSCGQGARTRSWRFALWCARADRCTSWRCSPRLTPQAGASPTRRFPSPTLSARRHTWACHSLAFRSIVEETTPAPSRVRCRWRGGDCPAASGTSPAATCTSCTSNSGARRRSAASACRSSFRCGAMRPVPTTTSSPATLRPAACRAPTPPWLTRKWLTPGSPSVTSTARACGRPSCERASTHLARMARHTPSRGDGA
mmetsp:Transcript_3994/g.16028  ORF Transcript_3994/g.16028 Transcript_3994/m.16028 type:complete len:211 (-) Transcript_3994:1-633(-)